MDKIKSKKIFIMKNSFTNKKFRIKSKNARDKYITAQADVSSPKLILFELNSKFSQ